MDIERILDEKAAVNIYKQFLTGLEEFDYEQLGEILEKKFLRKITMKL